MKDKNAYKTIGEVCEILNLIDPETGRKKTHVLRFWEKHFTEMKPSLIYKGRRYYSEKNILITIEGLKVNQELFDNQIFVLIKSVIFDSKMSIYLHTKESLVL